MPEDQTDDSDSLTKTSKKNFSSEWALFIHSFTETEITDQSEVIISLKNKGFSAEQLQEHKKRLSFERKKINQKIENIKSQIEMKNQLIENLNLVGSPVEDVHDEITQLSLEGEKLSAEVFKLEKELKKMRQLETIL
jgi:prefoldin subunit 5